MKAQFTALLASLALLGCGGGSNSQSSPPDNTAALAQAAQNAAGAYSAQHLQNTPPTYTGSFVTVSAAGFSVAQGFISGTSERNVVEALAKAIVAEPVKNAAYYQAMLSDAGLTFRLMGEKVGTGIASGLPLYAPDTIYTVKLTANGLVIAN